jgi:predicted site-specific integrase-resolvase
MGRRRHQALADKLLTKKDLCERWQVTPRAIDQWVRDGRLTPCQKVPGDMRFSISYIDELEGVKMNKLSPLERRRMEKEIEELTVRLEKAEGALARAQSIITEAIYFQVKEA